MSGATFPAFRFDGRTALAQEVDIGLDGRSLVVTTRDGSVLERIPLDPAGVSERFAEAPRIVALEHGGSLEIPDADGRLDRALEAAGVYATRVQRMQRLWPAALLALAGLVGVLAFAYERGLPAAAHWVALRLPANVEQRLGDEILRQLDRRIFHLSRLPQERRDALTARFAAAAQAAAPDVRYRLTFRRIDGVQGVNAMALPGGTIVLLDGLVEIANDDDALMGVLGHELGHVAGKHSMRQLLQSLGIGAVAGVVWGDFSSIAANVPVAFGILRYARDFEREADDFALALLEASGISPHPLADLFTTLEHRAEERGERKRGQVETPAFLASHPPTAERIQRLREAGGP